MGEPPELEAGAASLVGVRQEHVADLVRILATEPVRRRWGDEGAQPGWPFDDPSETRLSVLLDGRVVGMVQFHEELEPMYRHAGIDIFLDPEVHGRHLGRAVVGAVARHLIEDRGHHRLVIDPAADNEQAIRCYRAVGFRPVGVMRRYERDADGTGWHDGLLMDLVPEDLEP